MVAPGHPPFRPPTRGVTLGWQGAVIDPVHALVLSNPVWFAVH